MLNRLIRCLADIKQGRTGFEQLPPAFWDPEIYGSLVYFDWHAIQFIPDEHKTVEMAEVALDQSGLALQWVPRALKLAGLCERAVRADPEAIAFVPPELATEAMYAHWCSLQDGSGPFLEDVPLRFRSAALCAAAVRLTPNNIFAVPPSAHTPEVVAAFLKAEIGEICLSDLPKHLRTVPLSRAMLERGLGEPIDVPEDVREQLPAELLKIGE